MMALLASLAAMFALGYVTATVIRAWQDERHRVRAVARVHAALRSGVVGDEHRIGYLEARIRASGAAMSLDVETKRAGPESLAE